MHSPIFSARHTVTRIAAAIAALSFGLTAQTQFLGVAAGDTTSTGAILWTRAVDSLLPGALSLTLELAVDPAFATIVTSVGVATDVAADNTAKAEVTGLLPATRYYYRFRNGTETSGEGTFKTAPAADSAVAVRFAFSGDCDGLMRPYPLASVFPTLNLDYFVFLGDTMYEAASQGSAAVALSGTLPAPSASGATEAQLFDDYSRKYREQFLAVNAGGQECLKPLFASQGNYTLLDNHELGNRQYINGGAAPGDTVGGMPTGAGVDARVQANDVNASGAFMNQSVGFRTLRQVYIDHQPVKARGPVSAPADPRTDGTEQLYFAQRWGSNLEFFNVDDRSYRDIRMKTAANADETSSPRADNPARTMLGATQLAWLEQELLAARDDGVVWKIIAISSPIDQLGAIGSGIDGGKSWMGGYRAERNELLRFLADNHIENVVFLTTDDHQTRINEVLYAPNGATGDQASYVPVPRCFSIVCGPLGATGPNTITDHSYANIEALANSLASSQIAANVDPIGLAANYPGLHGVVREGDPSADVQRAPIDFFSPDTFNFAVLSTSADGATLSVELTGIDSAPANAFVEYDPIGNPARQVLAFEIDAFAPCTQPVCGQVNTACATLLVNGTGEGAQGPLAVSIPLGGSLALAWQGPANQGLLLATSPALVPGQRLGSLVVDLDLGNTSFLFGVLDPIWGGLYVTDAQGHAAQSFSVPTAMHGITTAVQGVLLDFGHVCSSLGVLTTASYQIAF